VFCCRLLLHHCQPKIAFAFDVFDVRFVTFFLLQKKNKNFEKHKNYIILGIPLFIQLIFWCVCKNPPLQLNLRFFLFTHWKECNEEMAKLSQVKEDSTTKQKFWEGMNKAIIAYVCKNQRQFIYIYNNIEIWQYAFTEKRVEEKKKMRFLTLFLLDTFAC